MKRFLFVLPVLCLMACQQNKKEKSGTADIHSQSAPQVAKVKHLELQLNVDFDNKQLNGKASWEIEKETDAKQIILDTYKLQIDSVTLGKDEEPATYKLGDEVKFLGQALTIDIQSNTTIINIYYKTSPEAPALQWLSPQQTAGKKQPFLFTQSQAILARSWIPCQDSPAIRFTYNAEVTVPENLLALMSAENPQRKSTDGVYKFKQEHPISSYLMALSVGDLAFKAVDERTGVYAEPVVLDKAAWEFADMGKMVSAAEQIYGPYRWGRYDFLVLPPSFPFGGMENPMLTFGTPTVIAGDRSLVALVAHELAHSWSGNLVTNATWNDFWLNEGFTVYFERRIIEAVYGKPEKDMQEVLGLQDLKEEIDDFGAEHELTKLKTDLAGHDPDEGMTNTAYEKGYFFLRTIEEAVGREKFDAFLRKYFDSHAFQSMTTEQFLEYLDEHLIQNDQEIANKIMVDDWVYKPGIPDNIVPVSSAVFKGIDSLIAKWEKEKSAQGLSKVVNSTNGILYFLRHLPETVQATDLADLDKEFGFTNSGNAEIQTVWYGLAIKHGYKVADTKLAEFLTEVGRRKFLVPLYKELIKSPEGKIRAKEIYEKARPNYHPVAYQTIDELLK